MDGFLDGANCAPGGSGFSQMMDSVTGSAGKSMTLPPGAQAQAQAQASAVGYGPAMGVARGSEPSVHGAEPGVYSVEEYMAGSADMEARWQAHTHQPQPYAGPHAAAAAAAAAGPKGGVHHPMSHAVPPMVGAGPMGMMAPPLSMFGMGAMYQMPHAQAAAADPSHVALYEPSSAPQRPAPKPQSPAATAKPDGSRWANQYINETNQARLAEGNIGDDELRQLSKAVVDGVQDPRVKNSNLIQFLSKISEGTVRFEDGEMVVADDSPATATPAVAASTTTAAPVAAPTTTTAPIAAPTDATAARPDTVVLDKPIPSDLEYQFQPNNPYVERGSALDAGLNLLKAGNIAEAILAFEAAVLEDESSLAWQMLGLSHAENDKDFYAVMALERAVELDAHNNEALMHLAVAYTNESNRAKALEVLERWIRQHPDYAHLDFDNVSSADPFGADQNLAGAPDVTDPGEAAFYQHFTAYWKASLESHARVTNMFLGAVRANTSSGADLDADVQIGLGILLNLSHEFAKAAECFAAALEARPDDYMLWNKLGATLANSSRCEEAIDAYHNSLLINPSYVRAKVNMGISYSNLKDFESAAVHYLGALTMEPRSQAEHIWHLLRMALALMNREDLVKLTYEGNLDAFRPHFEF